MIILIVCPDMLAFRIFLLTPTLGVDTECNCHLGQELMQQSDPAAIPILLEMANQGHVHAMHDLFELYSQV